MTSPFTDGPATLKPYRPLLRFKGQQFRVSGERWQCDETGKYFQTAAQKQREKQLLEAAYSRKNK